MLEDLRVWLLNQQKQVNQKISRLNYVTTGKRTDFANLMINALMLTDLMKFKWLKDNLENLSLKLK